MFSGAHNASFLEEVIIIIKNLQRYIILLWYLWNTKNKVYPIKPNAFSLSYPKNIMRKINPRSSDIDSYKYSILISIHYYDISFHPERISKLKPFENKNNFIHITLNKFEINNPNTSFTVFDENNKILYTIMVLRKHKLFNWKMIDMQQ